MMNTPTSAIGIVILDYNQLEITERCLRSIAAGTLLPDEVVLVENGLLAETQFSIRTLPFKVTFLSPGRNLGCAGGRNLGLHYLSDNTNASILIILDNDTIIPTDFIQKVAKISIDSSCVIAPVIYDLGTNGLWSCGGSLGKHGNIEQLTIFSDMQKIRYEVDWAPGACLIMKKRTWASVGEFDEWLNFLFEDIEWCRRLTRLEGKVYVDRNLRIIHDANQSLGGKWSPARVYLWARNGTFFIMHTARPGVLWVVLWLCRELKDAVRDFVGGYRQWSISRISGLCRGLIESFRRISR